MENSLLVAVPLTGCPVSMERGVWWHVLVEHSSGDETRPDGRIWETVVLFASKGLKRTELQEALYLFSLGVVRAGRSHEAIDDVGEIEMEVVSAAVAASLWRLDRRSFVIIEAVVGQQVIA